MLLLTDGVTAQVYRTKMVTLAIVPRCAAKSRPKVQAKETVAVTARRTEFVVDTMGLVCAGKGGHRTSVGLLACVAKAVCVRVFVYIAVTRC